MSRFAGWRGGLTALMLLALAACDSKIELYGNLNARDANEMLALLLRHGIAADKAPGKAGLASVMVDSKQVPDATALLANAGLPRDNYANLGDLFKKEGMISSPTEERVRYVYGLTQELQRTLSGIDGVLSARVHVVLPEVAADGVTAKPSSAAVLLRTTPTASLDPILPKIKELVANSLEGMSYDKVSVIVVKATPEAIALGGPVPPGPAVVVYGLAAGLAASVLGNIALGALLWRRRSRQGAAIPAVT